MSFLLNQNWENTKIHSEGTQNWQKNVFNLFYVSED